MPAWTFDTPGSLRLDLEIPSGRIEIETAAGDTTQVELEALTSAAQELVDDARVDVRDRGDGQEVRVEVRTRSGIFISFGRGPEVLLRISCPPGADVTARTKSADVQARGEYGSFELKTASGDVHVDEVHGDARMKTASGDVSLDTVLGTTHVQSASGDVAVQQSQGDIAVQLVSGDFWIRDAGGSVHANTVSGDQRIEAVTQGAVEAHAVSGDVYVGIRRGSRVYVDANTISGSTSSEFELSDAPQSPAEESGPLVEVRAKTVSGDVAIVRAAAPSAAQQQSPAG